MEISLTQEHWESMRIQVEAGAPEEVCGLLAGQNSQVTEVIPISNELRSQVRYRMNPQDQWRAFKQMEAKGQELVGIYHSHPRGPDFPSVTDVAEAFYPEAAYLIWSGSSGEWRCRGFRIQEGRVTGVPLRIVPVE